MKKIGHLKEIFSLRFWKFIFQYIWEAYRQNSYSISKLGEYNNSVIHKSASFRESQLIFLKSNVYINEGCVLWAGMSGKITIGKNTLLGPNVMIFSSNHGISKDKLIVEQTWIEKDVTVGADCWLGANSIILPGVNLGVGTVVAAGSIVTHNTEPYSIVAGCPAKILSIRK